MTRSRLALAAGCLAACSLTSVSGLAPAGAQQADQMTAVELLDRAREAAQTQAFDGMVTVEWRDGKQRHSERVPVRNVGGVLRFGDEVIGAGARRMVHGTDGWLSLWGHDVATLGPPPTAKYRLAVEPGPDVAGRVTWMVVVQLIGGSRPRERLYLDRQTGLLLRRELLDANGAPLRAVAFTSLSHAGAIEVAARSPLSSTPRVARSQEPSPARHLKAPYKLKSRIGSGYRRVGAYKANGVVQQFYSDGLHGLSVFEQRGHLKGPKAAGAAGAGRRVEIAGRTMRAYSASVGEAVVWESDGVVYTAVTDGPWSDLAEAVEDLPHGNPPGRLRRVAQSVVSLFRWK